jgi:hypothetical protein
MINGFTLGHSTSIPDPDDPRRDPHSERAMNVPISYQPPAPVAPVRLGDIVDRSTRRKWKR